MHWTLQVQILLCLVCAAGNVTCWWITRQVRTCGVLVCAGWLVQELYWWAQDHDSFLLIAACDAAILGWFWRNRGALDRIERLVAAILPCTVAAYGWQFAIGESVGRWWANWSLVTLQMTLGLPWLMLQKINSMVSHGSVKSARMRGR